MTTDRAAGIGGMMADGVSVNLSGSNVTADINVGTLSNMVYKATPTFKWKFVANTPSGLASNEFDQTSHTIYVTYADPISDGGSLTDMRLKTVIARASGQTNIIGVADSIYNLSGLRFDMRTQASARNFALPQFPTVDDSWYMYSPVDTGWDVRGSCVARATLNQMELEMLGINAGSVVYIRPVPSSSYCSTIEQTVFSAVTTGIGCPGQGTYPASVWYCAGGSANQYEGTLKVVAEGTTEYYPGLPDGDWAEEESPIEVLTAVADNEFWVWQLGASPPDSCIVSYCGLLNSCVSLPPFNVPTCP